MLHEIVDLIGAIRTGDNLKASAEKFVCAFLDEINTNTDSHNNIERINNSDSCKAALGFMVDYIAKSFNENVYRVTFFSNWVPAPAQHFEKLDRVQRDTYIAMARAHQYKYYVTLMHEDAPTSL